MNAMEAMQTHRQKLSGRVSDLVKKRKEHERDLSSLDRSYNARAAALERARREHARRVHDLDVAIYDTEQAVRSSRGADQKARRVERYNDARRRRSAAAAAHDRVVKAEERELRGNLRLQSQIRARIDKNRAEEQAARARIRKADEDIAKARLRLADEVSRAGKAGHAHHAGHHGHHHGHHGHHGQHHGHRIAVHRVQW